MVRFEKMKKFRVLEQKTLKERILQEVIEELNRRQHVPVSFYGIDIELKDNGIAKGTLSCAETHHTWKIPLLVEINKNEVRWKAAYNEWVHFEL